jgi:hypothetical protein
LSCINFKVPAAWLSQSQTKGILLKLEQSIHRPAVGMAADDDLFDVEGADGIFDRRTFAPIGGPKGRNNIACVADDEQIPRLSLGDQIGINPRIRAGDHQHLRRLTIGELFKEVAVSAK